MSEWEFESDFSVNKAVAELLGLTVDHEQYLHLNDRFKNAVLCHNGKYISLGVDYCNASSGAWPIILDNQISIEFRDHKSLKPIAKRFGSNSHNVAHENPLRAAMIVFLEMNGVKPNE